MQITGPSGKVYEWKKPPRHVHWKHGRVGQAFASKLNEINASMVERDETEKGIRLMESLSDSEVVKLQAYVDDVLKAGLGHAPDDVPENDYWFLFGQAVYSTPDAKIETTEGTTTVAAVDSFRAEPELSTNGEDVPHVRPEPVEEDGDIRPAAV